MWFCFSLSVSANLHSSLYSWYDEGPSFKQPPINIINSYRGRMGVFFPVFFVIVINLVLFLTNTISFRLVRITSFLVRRIRAEQKELRLTKTTPIVVWITSNSFARIWLLGRLGGIRFQADEKTQEKAAMRIQILDGKVYVRQFHAS